MKYQHSLVPGGFFPTVGNRRPFFSGWSVLTVAFFWFLAAACSTEAQTAKAEVITLHIGFTRSSFRNVSASDATAAFKIFGQTAAARRGYKLDTDARLFETREACEAAIKQGKINMAILDAWDYLGLDAGLGMEPLFVPLEQGTPYREYMVLTRRGSGLTNLASLKGKNLMVMDGKGGNLSRAWLESELSRRQLGGTNFFRKLDFVSRPAAAVLPVFFNSKPACLVDQSAFQIMAELNPQVGSNLVAVATSPLFLENIICLSKTGWTSEGGRQAVIRAIAELQLEPSGKQILELFKLDQLIPFKEEYLETARQLRAQRPDVAGLAPVPGPLSN